MNFLKTLMAAVLALGVTGAAEARVFGDEVTYVNMGTAAYPYCLEFQTVKGNGVKGVDNRSGGNTTAAGYTGSATVFGIGIGPAGTWTYNSTEAAESHNTATGANMLFNSRYSPGLLFIDYGTDGVNTSHVYTDYCDVADTIISKIGQ